MPFFPKASWPGFLYCLKYLGFGFVCVCRPIGVWHRFLVFSKHSRDTLKYLFWSIMPVSSSSSFYMTDTFIRLSSTGLSGECGCGQSQPSSWRVDDSQSQPISSLLHTHGYCLSVRRAQSTALFTASQYSGLNGEEQNVTDHMITTLTKSSAFYYVYLRKVQVYL